MESLRRIRAAADTHRELPKVDYGHSVEDFFATILKTTNDGKDLVTWSGELYLEASLYISFSGPYSCFAPLVSPWNLYVARIYQEPQSKI